MKPMDTPVYSGFGIFASYDDLAPDTACFILCDTEETAHQVIERLESDPSLGRRVAFTEGFEYAKQWRIRQEIRPRENQFSTSVESALEMFEEE